MTKRIVSLILVISTLFTFFAVNASAASGEEFISVVALVYEDTVEKAKAAIAAVGRSVTVIAHNENVILCERGIRTFETYTRNTLDLSAVSVLHDLSHLPVVVDPSHGTGKANLVTPMALAATAAGADGVMIEVHNDPAHALCDGAQSLTPDKFAEVARKVSVIREAMV